MEQVKEINIKNCTYYYFNDKINTEDLDSNLLKKAKNSYKNIQIITTKKLIIKKIFTV